MSPSAVLYTSNDPNRIFALLPDIGEHDRELIERACHFSEKAHEGNSESLASPIIIMSLLQELT